MKILVFEYITGGGLNKQALPESLLQEGRLMLDALLADFKQLTLLPQYAELSVLVMLDARLKQHMNTHDFKVAVIDADQDCYAEFKHYTQQCDAVWPIAPEFDDILHNLCLSVEQAKKHVLTSAATAVALTGNKFNSYLHFKKHRINTVPTRLFKPGVDDISVQINSLLQESNTKEVTKDKAYDAQWIIKPIAGVGCMDSYVLPSIDSLKQIAQSGGDTVIQPHINGEKLSLSCLFKNGEAWLLSVNQQHFTVYKQQYHLDAITVNVPVEQQIYKDLIAKIALAIPELWGYVGIDLIKTPTQVFVLEINPRLTTSFVGIQAALGLNIVQNTLQLVAGQPSITITKNHAITIKVSNDTAD